MNMLTKACKDVYDTIYKSSDYMKYFKKGPFFVADEVTVEEFDELVRQGVVKTYGLQYRAGRLSMCGDETNAHRAVKFLFSAMLQVCSWRAGLGLEKGENMLLELDNGMFKVVDCVLYHLQPGTFDSIPLVAGEVAFLNEEYETLKENLQRMMSSGVRLVVGMSIEMDEEQLWYRGCVGYNGEVHDCGRLKGDEVVSVPTESVVGAVPGLLQEDIQPEFHLCIGQVASTSKLAFSTIKKEDLFWKVENSSN